ncbi:MAG: 4a-hydroxytetrahydrobiopterin dehydratase [Bacteroidales bacterium]
MDLGKKKCKPCEGGIPPLNTKEVEKYINQLKDGWSVTENQKISKEYSFVNFRHTMDFVNKVADLAEDEGHHPDMHVYYGKVVIELWTHAINGLSENDFILAWKTDRL